MTIQPWREFEIALTAGHDVPNPYTGVNVEAVFSHDTGLTLRRPGFWDGGRTWRIRFASPIGGGTWSWRTSSNLPDSGLDGCTGDVPC